MSDVLLYLMVIGVLLLSLFIAFLIVISYLKLLNTLGDLLESQFHKNIGNTRNNSRAESRIIICGVYCFDEIYKFLYTNIFRRISGVIKYCVRNKPISENGNNSDSYRRNESNKKYLEHFLKECHGNKSTTAQKDESTKTELNHFFINIDKKNTLR